MDFNNVLEFALAGLAALGAFIMKQLHTKVDETDKALQAHKQHVAENYANNNTVRELRESMDKRFDRIEDKLDKALISKDV